MLGRSRGPARRTGGAELALAIAFAAAASTAQQRHLCIGRIVDDRNVALADAEITLAALGPAGDDVVTCRSDARGHFRADLLVARAYSTWAMATALDGSLLATDVEPDVAAGQTIELVAMHKALPRTVAVSGCDNWRLGAPTIVEWTKGPGVTTALAVAANGAVVLPPGPPMGTSLRLRTPNGEIAGSAFVAATDTAPSIAFEPPTELHVAVTTANDAPAACADIEQYAAGCWRRAGITGDDGTTTARLIGGPNSEPHCWLRARLGNVVSYSTIAASMHANGTATLVLPSAPLRPARILGVALDEIVTGTVTGIVRSRAKNLDATRGMTFPVSVRDRELAAEALPQNLDDISYELMVTPHDGPPRVVVTSKLPSHNGALPRLDLAELTSVRVRAVDAANNPLPGARLGLLEISDADEWAPRLRWFALDHGGRLDLMLDPRTQWAVYVASATGHDAQLLDGKSVEVRLVANPMPSLRCRVLDDTGRPVRGAHIATAPKTIGGASPQHVRSLQMVREVFARDDWRFAVAARSDADGVLTVPVQDWLAMTRLVHVVAGSRTSTPFELQPGLDLGDLVVR